MKKILLFVTLVLSFSTLFSQTITIKGNLSDLDSEEPIMYATVALRTLEGAIAKGGTSDTKGNFELANVLANNYKLVVTYVGYDTLTVDLINLSQTIDLGRLELKQSSTQLDEVTVKASSVIEKSDKKLFFPTKDQVEKSANGLYLTQRLMLPELIVNTQNSSISYAGNKRLKILINGLDANSKEVLALRPNDVSRVEYFDNPGLRYGDDVGLIINYITKQRTTGGFMSANLFETLTRNLGNGQVSGGFNSGKSQLRFYYYLNHNDATTSSTKQQTFLFPDNSVVNRSENAKKDHWNEVYQSGNLSYTYFGEKNTLNVKADLFSLTQPHNDLAGDIKVSNTDNILNFHKNNSSSTLRPSIDVYFTRQLSKGQLLAFNMVGTYNKNTVDYEYRESNVADIKTHIEGKRRSLISEAFYEKQTDNGSITAGLKHTQGKTVNEYSGSIDYNTELTDALSYGFIQYGGKIKKLGYLVGLGVEHTYFHQESQQNTYDKWTVSPIVNVSYAFSNKVTLRYTYQLKNINPSLSELSEVERILNNFEINKGNPLLHSYFLHENSLRLSFNKSPFRSSLSINSSYYNNPIMEKTYFESQNNMFVRTFSNQKNYHHLQFQGSLGVSLFNNHLSINGYGGYNHRTSNGDDYYHSKNDWFYVLQMIGDYKKWTMTVTLVNLTQPFWGETATIKNSYNQYSLNRRFSWGQIGVSAMNIFGEKSIKHSYNYNKLTFYHYEANNKKLYPSFGVNCSVNLNWGKQTSGKRQQLNNIDTDSGIL